jgi:putative ABC transport system substrate-binding protein
MRRREFITLLGGAAVTWPVVGLAQQVEHAKRVGVLAGLSTGADSELQARIAALKQTLRDLGWIENRNIIFDIRFAEGKPELLPSLAAELVRTPSDVLWRQARPQPKLPAALQKRYQL